MINGLVSIIKLIREIRKEGDETEADCRVFDLFTKALNDSNSYIQSQTQGAESSRDKELEIAELWRLLAVELRRVDSPLVRRAWNKSQYWIRGAKMEVEELSAKGIRLYQMEAILENAIRRIEQ